MDEGPLIVFAGGGTGGHLFPALSVADCLRQLDASVRVQFWATRRPIDARVIGGAGHEWIAQQVSAFPGAFWNWPGFLVGWWGSVRRSVRSFRRNRPAIVVGAGGYAAGPPVRAAEKLALPIALLNPDAVPGRANRHLGSLARDVFVQWERSRNYFDAGRVHVTGCPVRASFLTARRQDGIERFGLVPEKKTLLITGASQGARTINEAMLRVWPALAGRAWQVLHLTGPLDFQRMRDAYASIDPTAKVLSFTDRMAEALASADLVIARAGASTLAELTAVGRASVLMPYPYHKDQHQLANAGELSKAGATEIVIDRRQPEANAEALGTVLAGLMQDDARLSRMSQAAKKMARPDAGRLIAQRLLEVG